MRRRVRKHDVSFGPVNAAGRLAWDTYPVPTATAEKLEISFWSYLVDRVHAASEIRPQSEACAFTVVIRTVVRQPSSHTGRGIPYGSDARTYRIPLASYREFLE